MIRWTVFNEQGRMQKTAEGVAGCERLLENSRKKKKTAQRLRRVWKSSSMRLLAVSALLFCVVVRADQERAEGAVKLCGREFLRAVVYTCGGSRWKRFFSEPDMSGLTAEQQNSLENLSSPGISWTKRDMNNFLTNLCCQMGCRKSALTYLC